MTQQGEARAVLRSNLAKGLAVIAILALAIGLSMQAASGVIERSAPEQAVSLFPTNGEALERVAFQEFSAGVVDPSDSQKAALNSSGHAKSALRADPSSPKAHAILALSKGDAATRLRLLEGASLMNRRDLTLQSLMLQEHVGRSDFPAAVETLDQILRVHPERSREFFPVLTNALEEQQTISAFADILDGGSPWHNDFLSFALGQQDSLGNLASLREQIDFADESLDRRLVRNLARVGDIDASARIYQLVTNNSISSLGNPGWAAGFPPFDWQLADDAGFRAQPSRDGERLELHVRPGKGGAIAARIMSNPQSPFTVKIDHRITPAEQLRDVQLQLVCVESRITFFEERFSKQGDGFRVDNVPVDCKHMLLAINARSWSGRSALSGTISEIELAAQ